MSPPDSAAIAGNRWDLLDARRPDPPPMVSVIVAHYRQPRQLARTLRALERQDHPRERLQIIVADDGSPDFPHVPEGVQVVRQDDAGFRLAAVRNLGAAAATGEVLVFLDADTSPEPQFVRELVRLPALAPDCITVGRRRHARLDRLQSTDEIERAAPDHELPEPDWLKHAYRATRNLLDADDRSYRYVIGAVLACSRSFFDEVGGFDESFTTYGGEDWEWAYRAWVGGAMLAHVPSAIAWHDGPDAAGRTVAERGQKNAEAIRLSELIPIGGSRPHGLRPTKVDIAVTGPPPPATDAQIFVSTDSVLAAIPGAEAIDREEYRTPDGRKSLDRVRLRVEILRPLIVAGGELAAAAATVGDEQLGELIIVDSAGRDLIRVVSTRAEARRRRWGRHDLFPTVRKECRAVTALPTDTDLDVEGYLGGWGLTEVHG